jgi:hypothetical protein
MAEYNSEVVRTLFHTIGDNLGDLIVEELEGNQPSNVTFPEVTKQMEDVNELKELVGLKIRHIKFPQLTRHYCWSLKVRRVEY